MEYILLGLGITAFICLWIIIILMILNRQRKRKKNIDDVSNVAPMVSSEPSPKEEQPVGEQVDINTIFRHSVLANAVSKALKINAMEPISRRQLDEVYWLDLSKQQLTDFRGIEQLKHLKELDLQYTQLAEVPKELAELRQLSKLNLSHNQLRTIDPLLELKALETIDVSANECMTIPAQLFAAPHLKDLNVAHNNISVLPETLPTVSSIEKLNLAGNAIAAFPASMAQELPQMQELNLAGNQLTELPFEIAQLPSLQQLNVDDNTQLQVSSEILEQLLDKGIEIQNNNIQGEVANFEAVTDLDFASIAPMESEGDKEMTKKLNTYIDLTGSHDNLLEDLDAFEPLEQVSTDVFADKDEAVQSLITDETLEDIKASPEHLNATVNELIVIEDKPLKEEENENMLKLSRKTETKDKQKMNKLIGAIGVAVGVGVAVAGAATYLLSTHKDDDDKKPLFPFKKKND